jgi:hypothetical protein
MTAVMIRETEVMNVKGAIAAPSPQGSQSDYTKITKVIVKKKKKNYH